jgi:hypothetical protein
LTGAHILRRPGELSLSLCGAACWTSERDPANFNNAANPVPKQSLASTKQNLYPVEPDDCPILKGIFDSPKQSLRVIEAEGAVAN